MLLYCFHYAGGSSSVFKDMKKEGYEIIPIQLPGRENRIKEPFFKDIHEAAEQILRIIKNNLHNYSMLGHSMGTWIVYEVYKLIVKHNLELPKTLYLSSFPGPQYSLIDNPIWKMNMCIPDKEFQNELRLWGVKEVVFKEPYWSSFKNMLRSDFGLFDSCTLVIEPIVCDVVLLLGNKDERITKDMMLLWCDLCEKKVTYNEIDGKHLFEMRLWKQFIL